MEKFTMLEILKKRLPDGLEIVKVKNKSNSSQLEIIFSFDGEEVRDWLYKTCEPGHENAICDRTISNAMTYVALKKNDLDMAKYWSDRALKGGGKTARKG